MSEERLDAAGRYPAAGVCPNVIVNQDCLVFMRSLPDDCVDLVVTSPPYATRRAGVYGGVSEDKFPAWFVEVGKEIHRILKPTGSFVLNIKEHVNSGARSTYVLKTVLALSEIFIWSDTYIWNKTNPFPTGSKKRLKDGFEYCYLFTKTKSHKFFPEHVLVECTSKWRESEQCRKNTGAHPTKNGSCMNMMKRCQPDMVRPSNVLTLAVDTSNHDHPAVFPLGLPLFFVKLLTEAGDLVYDPFAGSGTTCVAAKELDRLYLGSEIMASYAVKANERLDRVVEKESCLR